MVMKEAFDYLRRLAGPAADQIGYMLGDKAWEYRANNLISTTKRTRRKLNEAGLSVNAVPPRLLLPIIESCSVEDNDTLQEMWAGLLVTASQESDSMSPSFVETLKQLTPVEASLLQECWADTICPALETGRAAKSEDKLGPAISRGNPTWSFSRSFRHVGTAGTNPKGFWSAGQNQARR
jgi:hypothetical protein